MKNDGLGVFELSQKGGQPFFELVGGDPARAFDVTANVIW